MQPRAPVSTAELERRWSAVRLAMRGQGLDAVVMQNSSDWVGGYVRWFTDLPATNGYPRTVVFYPDRPMTVIEMGEFGAVRELENDPVHRGSPTPTATMPNCWSPSCGALVPARSACSRPGRCPRR
jgi:hypothetical protein